MNQQISLTYVDTKGLLTPEELDKRCQEAAPVLERAVKGDPRYTDVTGWVDVDENAGQARLDFLTEQARRVREEADALVVIGIGGSNQASRAVVKALQPDGCSIVWAGNTLSAYELKRTLRELDGYQSVFINCIAKNFETLEPGMTFRVLRQYLEDRYGPEDTPRRVFATGTPGSSLHQLCKDHGYTFLTFPEKVGGRYCVGSDVHLFPMAAAGVDINALVQGMRDMRQRLFREPAQENMALRYACIRSSLLKMGYRAEMLSFFEPRLDYFSKWWVQGFAESEGKCGTGLYPIVASNSEDLHSIGQFVQDGSPILFETFLELMQQDASVIIRPDEKKDYFDYLDGMDLWQINQIARRATFTAHSQRGIPCLNLAVPCLDAYWLGQLFYYFMFTCYLSCELTGVNPFDQPGVEGYKKEMFHHLGKPGY